MTNSNIQKKGSTGRLKANPVERAKYEKSLHEALSEGIDGIPTQLRALLMLSQANGARPSNAPFQSSAKRVSDARLETLSLLVSALPPDKRRAIFQEIRAHSHLEIRLHLSLRLIPYLEADMLPSLFKPIWEDIHAVEDMGLRARALLQLATILPNFSADNTVISQALMEAVGHARAMHNLEARIRSLVALSGYMPPALEMNFFKTILDEMNATSNDTLHATTIATLAERVTPANEEYAFRSAIKIVNASERARAFTALIPYISHDPKDAVRLEALSAITQIQSEDERVIAIVSFAKTLEGIEATSKGYPIYLEQALRIAISFTRRQLRARALVAIAPYLTSDLQGEALAAVNSLSQERERATLLAELAPTLPANMLVASLAVAHTMREQDARVHALTILAHHVPTQARSQTVLDALAAATNLPNHFERVTALMALVGILPPHLLDQAYTNALETARLIENENARARALNLIGQNMPQNLIPRALDIAYQIRDFQQRLNALVGLAPRLSKSRKADVMKQMLVCTGQIPFEYKQARALVSIAPHLQDEFLDDAIRLADGFNDPFDRVNAYLALLPKLDDDARALLITQSHQLTRHIEDGYDRASAVATLFPFLSESEHEALASESAEILRQIEDEYDRASAISILASVLVHGKRTAYSGQYDGKVMLTEALSLILNLPSQTQRADLLGESCAIWIAQDAQSRYELWADFVPKLAELPLADVLLGISALIPLLGSFGGDKLLREVAYLLEVR
ncbi:MAG: hypothetical protein SH821_16690 [Phototrophicales bacterium]|nr:hypothetical protein [Phototrophicales bacterium]